MLLITHLLACFTVAFLFRFWKNKKRNSTNQENLVGNDVCLENLGLILSQSIWSAIRSVVMIGGFIVFFNVILSIIGQLKLFELLLAIITPLLQPLGINTQFIIPILSGILELTSGVSLVSIVPCSNLGINVIICAFLLGVGGISILLQVWSITAKSDLSIKPYFIGKLLQGIFAAFYTFLIISNVSYFKFLLF